MPLLKRQAFIVPAPQRISLAGKRRLARTFHAALFAALFLLWAALPTSASERIILFSSVVTVEADGSLLVEESIRLNVEGKAIRRGIFRDFPTGYTDSEGKSYRVGFKLLSVTLDGRKEPYEVTSRSNGVRIRIGNPDRLVVPGEREYTLTYRTTGQLGFFDDHDELYWNVTGNGWEFPIDRAEAQILLPEGVDGRKALLFTGPQGSRQSRGEWRLDGNRAFFETTTSLGTGEGLTVVLAFDKGHVTPPSEAFGRTLPPSPWLVNAAPLLVLALVSAYYLRVWHRHGRDLKGGPIFARFVPPQDISPAFASRLLHRRFRNEALTATLVDLAVRKLLVIEEVEGTLGRAVRKLFGRKTAGSYRLRRLEGGKPSKEDALFLKSLFGRADRLDLTADSDKERLRLARESFRKGLDRDVEDCLRSNIGRSALGLGLSVLAFSFLLVAVGPTVERVFSVFWMALWTFFLSFLLLTGTAFLGRAMRTRRPGPFMRGLLLLFAAAPVSFLGLLGAIYSVEELSPLFTLSVIGTSLINALFIRIMGNVTARGRALLDELEGLKLYLSVAERERIRRFADVTLPPETPEQFERLLPWAIALGVEKEWAAHFETALAEARYEPTWYAGTTAWHATGLTSMASSLSSGLGGAIAAASSPPGSGSGFGSGGSSGGGGGGGGGGGW